MKRAVCVGERWDIRETLTLILYMLIETLIDTFYHNPSLNSQVFFLLLSTRFLEFDVTFLVIVMTL